MPWVQQKCIPCTSGGCKSESRLPAWWSSWEPFADFRLFIVSSHGGNRAKEFSGIHFLRARIPLLRMEPSGCNHLSEALLPNTITMGLGFSRYILRKHIQSITLFSSCFLFISFYNSWQPHRKTSSSSRQAISSEGSFLLLGYWLIQHLLIQCPNLFLCGHQYQWLCLWHTSCCFWNCGLSTVSHVYIFTIIVRRKKNENLCFYKEMLSIL